MSSSGEMHLCVSVEQSDYYPVLWKTETPLEAEDETDRFPVYTFVP